MNSFRSYWSSDAKAAIVPAMNIRRHQSGITFFGFLVFLVVGGFFVYTGIRLFPLYQEFYAVKAATASIAKDPDLEEMSALQIKESFLKRMSISYSENIKREHVKVVPSMGGWKIQVNYEVRRPLMYNLDVVAKFEHEKEVARGSRQ